MYPSSSLARWRQRAYLFGVTALAIVLVGSVTWRAISVRSPVYQATAFVNSRGSNVEGRTRDELLARRTSLPLSADVVRRLVITQTKDKSRADGVSVAATMASSAEAIRAVNRAAEYLAGPVDGLPDKPSRQALAQAQAKTARAREQLVAVQRSMAALVAEPPTFPDNLLLPQPASPAQRNSTEPGPQLTLENRPTGEVRPANPAWEDMHRELTALEARREELLQHMTDAHPTVQRLDREIAELIERLIASPRTINGAAAGQSSAPEGTQPGTKSQESAAEPADATPAPDPAAIESLRRQQAQFAQALTNQMQSLRQAESQLEVCLSVERQAAEEAQRPAAVSPWQVVRAHTAQRAAAAVSPWLGRVTVLLALGGGISMAWFGGRQTATFATRREAERLLPIPVIGLIETAGSNKARPSRLPRWIVRGIKRTCEATLAVALIASVLMSVSDFRADEGITEQVVHWGWEAMRSLTSG